MDQQWFAARHRPQLAAWARLNLEHQGFVTHWPTFPERIIRRVRSGAWAAGHINTAGSRQLIEQPLRFFHIGGVEALGEPTVDGGEQIMSLGPPALLAPQPTVAARSS